MKKWIQLNIEPSDVFYWGFWLLMLIPSIFAAVFIHELGHYIVGSMLGGKLEEFSISIITEGRGFVRMSFERQLTVNELILFDISGSLFSFIIGIVCFILFFYLKLYAPIEYFLLNFNIILTTEIFFYNILDILFLKSGDWWSIYQISPTINILFICGLLIYWIIYIKMYRKIYSKVDLDDLFD